MFFIFILDSFLPEITEYVLKLLGPLPFEKKSMCINCSTQDIYPKCELH